MSRYTEISIKITEPSGIVLERKADKVIAESENGLFCILPNHLDMATAIPTGIVYLFSEGQEHYIGVDEGLLVKCGNEVLISVFHAVQGNDLEVLHTQMEKRFKKEQEQEAEMGISYDKLEADLIKRFMELQKNRGAEI